LSASHIGLVFAKSVDQHTHKLDEEFLDVSRQPVAGGFCRLRDSLAIFAL
jgi:hypothetical protein